MFSFLKRIFSVEKKKQERKQELQQDAKQDVSISFGGGPGNDTMTNYWDSAWQEALKGDECYKMIPASSLADIEAIIKEATGRGEGAQKTATKLRPLFESIGLKRKDALKLAADVTNSIYKQKQANISIGNGIKFHMKTIDEKGNEIIVEENALEFVQNARKMGSNK